jgi:hypothetical protein
MFPPNHQKLPERFEDVVLKCRDSQVSISHHEQHFGILEPLVINGKDEEEVRKRKGRGLYRPLQQSEPILDSLLTPRKLNNAKTLTPEPAKTDSMISDE